jgi:hypothetical protein
MIEQWVVSDVPGESDSLYTIAMEGSHLLTWVFGYLQRGYANRLRSSKENGRDEELFVRITLLPRFAKIAVVARTRSLASLGAVLRRGA